MPFKNKAFAKRYAIDSVPDPILIYSFKKISSKQSLCVRVRRSSDNRTIDIGFVGDLLDIELIRIFAANQPVFIQNWYGIDGDFIEQNVIGNQPELLYNNQPPTALFKAVDSLQGFVPTKFTSLVSKEYSLLFKYKEITRSESVLFSFAGDALTSKISAHAPWGDGYIYFDMGDITTPSNRVVALDPVPIGTYQITEFTNTITSNYRSIIINEITIMAGLASESVMPTQIRIGKTTAPQLSIIGQIDSMVMFGSSLSPLNRTLVNQLLT